MISTISRDSEGTKTKSRRNELEDLRYGLSNHETLKLNLLCISLTLKARKIRIGGITSFLNCLLFSPPAVRLSIDRQYRPKSDSDHECLSPSRREDGAHRQNWQSFPHWILFGHLLLLQWVCCRTPLRQPSWKPRWMLNACSKKYRSSWKNKKLLTIAIKFDIRHLSF